jgi:hypothetical protein
MDFLLKNGATRTLSLQRIEFIEERRDMNYDTISNETGAGRIDETARKEMESKSCADAVDWDNDSMASVVAASTSCADVGIGGEDID